MRPGSHRGQYAQIADGTQAEGTKKPDPCLPGGRASGPFAGDRAVRVAACCGSSQQKAFTLIELLVVLAVVAILFGMSMTIGLRRNDTEANVKSAADELAAVLRATRTKAIERYATYAVVFNIQNGYGTSGKQLNNHNGGHYYRVIGPWRQSNAALTFPPFFNRLVCARDGHGIANLSSELAFRYYAETVTKAWDSDRHVLQAAKVRFVALTDQDNGDYGAWIPSTGNMNYAFSPTYPRPWFGWWDTVSHRLYPWGGYDHTLTGNRVVGGQHPSPTGFYYEGDDGAVTGSANQVDRLVVDDTNDDDVVDGVTPTYPLWKQGQPRPLINAEWQDYQIIFQPDGTVFTDWMRCRHGYGDSAPMYGLPFGDQGYSPTPAQNFTHLGIGDRCNEYPINFMTPPVWALEGSSYPNRSGFSWITLGGDLPGDDDHYPNVQAALAAIMPLYRVGVSPFGEVRVVKVVNSDRLGRTLDPTFSGALWNVASSTTKNYQNMQLTNNDGSPRGSPVNDVVTPDMLINRQWWWNQ